MWKFSSHSLGPFISTGNRYDRRDLFVLFTCSFSYSHFWRKKSGWVVITTFVFCLLLTKNQTQFFFSYNWKLQPGIYNYPSSCNKWWKKTVHSYLGLLLCRWPKIYFKSKISSLYTTRSGQSASIDSVRRTTWSRSAKDDGTKNYLYSTHNATDISDFSIASHISLLGRIGCDLHIRLFKLPQIDSWYKRKSPNRVMSTPTYWYSFSWSKPSISYIQTLLLRFTIKVTLSTILYNKSCLSR